MSIAIIVKSPLYCFFQQQQWPREEWHVWFTYSKTTPAMLGQRFLFKIHNRSYSDIKENWFCCVSLTIEIFTLKKRSQRYQTSCSTGITILSGLKQFRKKLPDLYLIIRAPVKKTFSHLLLQSLLCKKCFMCSIISFVTCAWQSRGVSRI